MSSIMSTATIGFIGIVFLLLAGLYFWLFGGTKFKEDDGRM
jgi:FlaG/FlaF family flagellin (archaellin)